MFKKGDKIGPYQLLEKVGRGQFGVVWQATKENALAHQQFAVKLPNDSDVSLALIRQEAETWIAAGSHPNILPILDASVYEGQAVLVSEFMPEGSLAGWLAQHGGRAPSFLAAIEMALGLLAGLEYLHTRPKPIVHRDLKPANILLQGNAPRLADFGLARVLKTVQETHQMGGAPSYMPPEAFAGDRSPQTDIWSAGVILQELLAGELPFPQTDIPSIYKALREDEPLPLPRFVPAPFRPVVRHALQKNPRERYHTAAEMRAALLAARETLVNFGLTIKSAASPTSIPPVAAPPQPAISLRSASLPAAPQPASLQRPAVAPASMPPTETPPHTGKKRRWQRAYLVLATLAVAALLLGVAQAVRSKLNAPAEKKPPQPYTETLPNGVKLEMVPIPPGNFLMGSPPGEKDRDEDEGPQHQVTLNYSFYMGKFEVTQAQWQAVMDANPSEFKGDNRPVEHVSWEDAKEFCQRLSKLTGRAYRLPSEAEWEYACRAGTTTAFAFGGSLSSTQANFDGNYPYGGAERGPNREETTPAGNFQANAFGLYDMHGNIWEWCEDIGHSDYQNAPADGSAWVSAGQFSMRVLRGGSFVEDGLRCRSALRLAFPPGVRARNGGLRLVATESK